MKFIERIDPYAPPVKINYEDLGSGKPVIFIHGWPLSLEMWEYQLAELPRHNLRCIAYDRRGFGHSDKPWEGYDYNTLAGDLHALIEKLNLEKVTLVGFSMGAGEVVRYMSIYGPDKISKIILIGSITPYLLRAPDNPDGIPREFFDDSIISLSGDRPAFLAGFGKKFFGMGILNKPVSDEMLNWTVGIAMTASPKATKDCVRSFSETDFREDLKKITVPALIIHGEMDKTVPIEISAKKTAKIIPHAKLKIYSGAAHGLYITDKVKLNRDLLTFIKEGKIDLDDQDMLNDSMDLSQSFNL
jgi:non-heme chloroperoxidase